jgi:hypothetical protein
MGAHDGSNGSNGSNGEKEIAEAEEAESALEPAPAEVTELAEACVVYVERETQVKLDYTPETLPLLDHWLRKRRGELTSRDALRDEILALVAAPAGAYLGEVARRIVPLRWFAPPGEHLRWRIELEQVFLSTNPIGAAVEALLLQEAEGWGAGLRLRPEDEVRARVVLDNIPEVEEEEYYAPSSRLEVIELVADALLHAAREEAGPDAEPRRYDATDYGPIRAEGIVSAIGAKGAS